MIRLFFTVTFLLLLFFSGCSTAERSPSSFKMEAERYDGFQGLEEVDPLLIDSWTNGLINGESKKEYPDGSSKKMQEAYYYAHTIDELFNKILMLELHRRYSNASQYSKLIAELVELKKELRPKGIAQENFLRQTHQLLNIMIQEVSYAMALQFPEEKIIEFAYPASTLGCRQKASKTNFGTLCQADIILTKSDKAIDHFLAQLSDHPSIYQQSCLVSYLPDQKITCLNVTLQQGVFESEEIINNQNIISIYRSKSSITQSQGIEGVDLLRKKLQLGTIGYDLRQDISDESSVTPAELVQLAYYLGGSIQTNPYATELLSSANSIPINSLFRWQKLFPALSDIELNPRYQLIATRINLQQTVKVRLNSALFSGLIENIKDQKESIQRLSGLLKKVSSLKETGEQAIFLSTLHQRFQINGDWILSHPSAKTDFASLVLLELIEKVLYPKLIHFMEKYHQENKDTNNYLSLIRLKQFASFSWSKEIEQLSEELDELL